MSKRSRGPRRWQRPVGRSGLVTLVYAMRAVWREAVLDQCASICDRLATVVHSQPEEVASSAFWAFERNE